MDSSGDKGIMLGYIYHLIDIETEDVIDETSLDEENLELATDLFRREFGYEKQFAAGTVKVVFSHTEEEEDFDDEDLLDELEASVCGEDYDDDDEY